MAEGEDMQVDTPVSVPETAVEKKKGKDTKRFEVKKVRL